MALTEEQRERIRRNRERALQKQKERKERLEKEKQENEQTEKRELEKKTIASSSPSNKKQKVELEGFEVGASEFISKTEAMKMYCVPQGTLAVCEVEERPNPHNQSWKPMKLYRRSEVRERGRKRWEGMEGLCAEREKRQQKQLKRDMEMAHSIFE